MTKGVRGACDDGEYAYVDGMYISMCKFSADATRFHDMHTKRQFCLYVMLFHPEKKVILGASSIFRQ